MFDSSILDVLILENFTWALNYVTRASLVTISKSDKRQRSSVGQLASPPSWTILKSYVNFFCESIPMITLRFLIEVLTGVGSSFPNPLALSK